MEYNCKWIKSALAVLILVFAVWPTLVFSAEISKWVVVVSAALILVHEWSCKKCCGGSCQEDMDEKPKSKSKKK
jgi:hypothetical protein